MNKAFLSKTTPAALSLGLILLLASVCSGQNNGGKTVSEMQTPYTVPAAKVQKWESLQNKVEKEYDICLEHCGYEQSCMDRCEAAYKNRLDREYRQLLNEKASASDN